MYHDQKFLVSVPVFDYWENISGEEMFLTIVRDVEGRFRKLQGYDVRYAVKVEGTEEVVYRTEEDYLRMLKDYLESNSLVSMYGVDAFRYFILKESRFGRDISRDEDLMKSVIQQNLFPQLENLLKSNISLVTEHFEGVLPQVKASEDSDRKLKVSVIMTPGIVRKAIDQEECGKALDSISKVISETDSYLKEQYAVYCKTGLQKNDRLAQILYNVSESLRITAVLLGVFLPDTGKRVLDAMNVLEVFRTWGSVASFGIATFPDSFSPVM